MSEAKRQTAPKRGNMPDQDAWGMMQIPFYGLTYRALMKFAHRHNWHHAKVFGPFEDGRYQRWCQWCGFRESYSYDPRKPLEGPIKLVRRGGRDD